MAQIHQPWRPGLTEEDCQSLETSCKAAFGFTEKVNDGSARSSAELRKGRYLYKKRFSAIESRSPRRKWPSFKPSVTTTESVRIDSCLSASCLKGQLARNETENSHNNFVYHSDANAFIAVLRNCAKHKDLRKGTRIHDDVLKIGLLEKCSDALITMYAKCGELSKAKELLDMHKSRDVFSWTALISGYAQRGLGGEAVDCFEQMKNMGLSPDAVTFSALLKACGSAGAADKGARIHDELVHQGLLENDVVLGTALIDMYTKCGALAKAEQVFQKLSLRNVITWSALLTGYAQQGEANKAYICYKKMLSEGFLPDAKTYACILKACGDMKAIEEGKQIHDEISRQGLLVNDVVLGTALVDMYAKCGVFTKARAIFANLPYQDVTSWSALIGGYAQHGHGEQALQAFNQMQGKGFLPNEVTFTAVLKACGAVGALEMGVQLNNEISRQGLMGRNILLDTALLDMYAKCGALSQAQKVLDEMPSHNISTWSALIAGYAQQGESQQALVCLERMQEEGISPDAMIFSSLLNACSHLGQVNDGHMYFTILNKKYGIKPELEHYACMIDLFGRTGHIDKAVGVIQEMPFSNNLEVWLVLLGSCRKWESVNVGRWAFEHVIQLDQMNTAGYVLMADLYATAGMHEDARNVSAMRKDIECFKTGALVR